MNTKMINRVPAEEERDGIRKRISELRTERSNLGFFKGKEKKEIDAQIEELEKASSQLDDVISDQRTRQREACKEEIKRVEILVKPIPERIKEIDDRIVAIEEELTKSR
jgi:chromosome segregation ATPase